MGLFLQTVRHLVKADGKGGNPYHGKDGKFTTPGQWAKISGKQGSNEGGQHVAPDGSVAYVKFYKNHEQARTEVAGSKIFELMGVETPEPRLEDVDGKPALATDYNNDIKKLSLADYDKITPAQANQVAQAYCAAILTKNWDVVGTGMDNLALNTVTGNIVEVDCGGSFNFRAQGEHKEFGPDIGEKESLLDKKLDAGQVFTKVFAKFPEALQNAVDWVSSLDPKDIAAAIKDSGLGNADEITKNIIERKKKLIAAIPVPAA